MPSLDNHSGLWSSLVDPAATSSASIEPLLFHRSRAPTSAVDPSIPSLSLVQYRSARAHEDARRMQRVSGTLEEARRTKIEASRQLEYLRQNILNDSPATRQSIARPITSPTQLISAPTPLTSSDSSSLSFARESSFLHSPPAMRKLGSDRTSHSFGPPCRLTPRDQIILEAYDWKAAGVRRDQRESERVRQQRQRPRHTQADSASTAATASAYSSASNSTSTASVPRAYRDAPISVPRLYDTAAAAPHQPSLSVLSPHPYHQSSSSATGADSSSSSIPHRMSMGSSNYISELAHIRGEMHAEAFAAQSRQMHHRVSLGLLNRHPEYSSSSSSYLHSGSGLTSSGAEPSASSASAHLSSSSFLSLTQLSD